jgi:hypothetical protein
VLKNPTTYRASQRRKETGWIAQLDALAEKARAEQRRLERAKHPRKKQPRHVRECQPLKPLNPHQR